MDVKEAVQKAKSHLTTVFSDEDISGVRLEEVEYDRVDRVWLITLGISRPRGSVSGGTIASFLDQNGPRDAYKIVRIPEDLAEYPSIRIRELGNE